ncbi:MAG: hypothetical protein ACRDSR_13900 [Pseudonocardiaceae bacterium]
MRDIQREFDRHPIRVPLRTDGHTFERAGHMLYSRGSGELGTTVYNGLVIQGIADGAQLAWGDQTVNQTMTRTEQIASGFEPIAQAVVGTLKKLPRVTGRWM